MISGDFPTAAGMVAAIKAVREHTAETRPDGSPASWTSHDSHGYNASCIVCRGDIEMILTVAVPVLLSEHREQIERETREKCSAELNAWADETGVGEAIGPMATRRRTLRAAARKIAPQITLAEVAAAINRGDFAGCYLDDAGRSIPPGSRLSDSGEAGNG